MAQGARNRQFLDPAVVARLGTLELRARTIVEGAESEARRMRHEVEDFCDRKLASFEVVLQKTVKLVAQGRDPSLPVVLYCSGGDCEDSHMLAQTLFGAGFENLLVYRDGFPDWVKRGGAARTGGPA